MSNSHVLVLLSIGIALGAMPASAEWSDWIADAEVKSEWTDNLNYSAFGSDRESDLLWQPGIRLGHLEEERETVHSSLLLRPIQAAQSVSRISARSAIAASQRQISPRSGRSSSSSRWSSDAW